MFASWLTLKFGSSAQKGGFIEAMSRKNGVAAVSGRGEAASVEWGEGRCADADVDEGAV